MLIWALPSELVGFTSCGALAALSQMFYDRVRSSGQGPSGDPPTAGRRAAHKYGGCHETPADVLSERVVVGRSFSP